MGNRPPPPFPNTNKTLINATRNEILQANTIIIPSYQTEIIHIRLKITYTTIKLRQQQKLSPLKIKELKANYH